MNPNGPTITQRGFAMLEAIKRECGIVSEPVPAAAATLTPYGKGLAKENKRRKYSQRERTTRVNPNMVPREGEIRLKEFLKSKDMSYTKAWEMFTAGAFNVSVRRVNKRVVFVRVKE